MPDTDIVISDIKLFIESLHKDLPEVFTERRKTPSLPFAQKLLYLGGLYEIKTQGNPQSPIAVEILQESAVVNSDGKTSPETILLAWLKAEAERIIGEKARFWSEKMSIQYNRLLVKDQRSLWGSCSAKRNLNFCWRLIKAPLAVVEYVVIHELAHLSHMNHGEQYWELVSRWCPDYKTHRKWLNTHKNEILSETKITA
ncbi:MAG: M48 family metallopeptidase [Elusimicrobia bacterium]|nr:M48 family metallopeptidase [Elusimicrobiota bacterium]